MPGFLQSALWITNAHGQNRELLTFVAQLRGQPNQSGTKPLEDFKKDPEFIS